MAHAQAEDGPSELPTPLQEDFAEDVRSETSSSRIPVCIFAKPPRPGRAKTRLAAAVGADVACRFAAAFISDALHTAMSYPWALPVLATTEDGMEEDSFSPECFPSQGSAAVLRWLQPQGDLGAKIEGIVRQGLATGAHAVVCLGADSPARPRVRLTQAFEAISQGYEAVIGPAADGGYDLLALSLCPAGVLADLPWSQPSTFVETRKRLGEWGMRVHILDEWWDVDEVEDLNRLQTLFEEDADAPARAPAVAEVLASFSQQALGRQGGPLVP